jgi:hypothetical protein
MQAGSLLIEGLDPWLYKPYIAFFIQNTGFTLAAMGTTGVTGGRFNCLELSGIRSAFCVLDQNKARRAC